MNELFDFIKAHLAVAMPELKTVRIWRNQFVRANIDRDEQAFRYPACFIEFVSTEYAANNPIGFRDVGLIVRFHLGIESYTLEKMEDIIIQRKLDDAVFRLRGNEEDPVHFTSLQKAQYQDEASDDNANEFTIDYTTIFREFPVVPDGGEPFAPVELDLTACVIDGENYCGPLGNLEGNLQIEL